MRLELKLNEFFSKYKLFTTSRDLLNLVNQDEVISSIIHNYPKLSKVIDVENIDETIISMIYSNKGSYKSIGILAKLMKTNVKIYSKSDSSLIYDSSTNIDAAPMPIGKIEFDSMDYLGFSQLKTGFIELVKDLIWYIDEESKITCEVLELDLVNDSVRDNEYNLNFIEIIPLNEG